MRAALDGERYEGCEEVADHDKLVKPLNRHMVGLKDGK
jgi:hypothetical protein